MPQRAGIDHLAMSAMDCAAEGITISDLTQHDQPLVYVNDGFLRMTGYSRDEVIKRNCRFLQGPDTNREQVAKIRCALQTLQPVTLELLNYRKNRTPFWNRLTLAPISKTPGGAAEYYVGVQSDITAYKVAELELRAYALRTKKINDEIEATIRNFTDEMGRSVFTSLRETQALLRDITSLSEKQTAQMLSKIRASNEQTNDLVSGLKVVLQSCGGVEGLVNIDPVTMTVRKNTAA